MKNRSNTAERRSMFNVLHLIPTLLSGGAERQLVGLVLNTARDRILHSVCVISDASFFGPKLVSNGIELIELGIHGKRPLISATVRFREIIRTHQPDVIHSWLYDASIVSRLSVLPFDRTPLITSWQLPDYEPSTIASAGWNPNKVAALKLIDRVTALMTRPYFVACSETVKRSYERNFKVKGRGIRTIYNAVDIRAMTSDPEAPARLRNELGLREDAFVFLNVGRLDPQKNHRLILQAFSEVADSVASAYLLLVGVGGLERELKKMSAELGLSERVRFLGRRNDVGDLLHYADVFVFPSLVEGLPVALVEAMYESLPCIASKIGVFSEVIEDGKDGILIDPISPGELASAMIGLSQNEELRESLGMRAFEKASARFDATSTARQWEELYAQIASERNA